ncbi:MAG: hypothetical protein ACTS73_00520 [Arsenophonus sp. NEOnobi-MAG3]
MSNEILEEFNSECISHFLELMIDKEFISFARIKLNDTKLLPKSIKLITIANKAG